MEPTDEHVRGGETRPLPLAIVGGEVMTELPDDVYIPPDALRVFLGSFEGPLDLLLYLIRKKNIDILDLPVAEITEQYIAYISMMRELHMDIAAEYLVMASTLTEIKSRMLLPRVEEDEDEEDPRAELLQRLLEYTRYKRAAEDINALPRLERDQTVAGASTDSVPSALPKAEVNLEDIKAMLDSVLERAKVNAEYTVERENLSVKERIAMILHELMDGRFVPFSSFFDASEGRAGVVVTVLAMLELLRARSVDFEQSAPYAPIYLRRAES